MAPLQNVVLAIAVGATLIEASTTQCGYVPCNRKMRRGTAAARSAISAEDAALNKIFNGCLDTMNNGANPKVAHNHDGSVSFVDYPAICETEAKEYTTRTPINGMEITVAGSTITVKNAPADFLASLHA